MEQHSRREIGVMVSKGPSQGTSVGRTRVTFYFCLTPNFKKKNSKKYPLKFPKNHEIISKH